MKDWLNRRAEFCNIPMNIARDLEESDSYLVRLGIWTDHFTCLIDGASVIPVTQDLVLTEFPLSYYTTKGKRRGSEDLFERS